MDTSRLQHRNAHDVAVVKAAVGLQMLWSHLGGGDIQPSNTALTCSRKALEGRLDTGRSSCVGINRKGHGAREEKGQSSAALFLNSSKTANGDMVQEYGEHCSRVGGVSMSQI